MLSLSHTNPPWLDALSRHALHHAALDYLKLQNRLEGSEREETQDKLLIKCQPHLVEVFSLLHEFVNYFLGLTITLLLQVSDECVQVAWTVIRLYDRLVRLNDTSDACK